MVRPRCDEYAFLSSLVLLTKVLPVEVEEVRGVEEISGAGVASRSLLLR